MGDIQLIGHLDFGLLAPMRAHTALMSPPNLPNSKMQVHLTLLILFITGVGAAFTATETHAADLSLEILESTHRALTRQKKSALALFKSDGVSAKSVALVEAGTHVGAAFKDAQELASQAGLFVQYRILLENSAAPVDPSPLYEITRKHLCEAFGTWEEELQLRLSFEPLNLSSAGLPEHAQIMTRELLRAHTTMQPFRTMCAN